ncbi:hypothetical protein BJY01DRAFT_243143 [Aspergillus pseudoustus]|uniref:Uncharacterized protein n=1 Tax=Aspergillus pseudoustus TaxID=1810923 RepID=A0ABR4KW04_9EURO
MDDEFRPAVIEVTADVARILEEAQILSILMGWQVLCIYDQPNDYGDIIYVIRDDLVDSAKDALVDATAGTINTEYLIGKKYPLCSNITCMELQEDRWGHREFYCADWQLARHPRPAYHFHAKRSPWGFVVHLVRKSEFLLWLPDSDMELSQDQPGLKNDHAYLTVSTDPDLPFPWLGQHPV